MVDVADGAYVHVRFGSFKFILSHLRSPYTLAANVFTANRLDTHGTWSPRPGLNR
jgi:hypothetical protein